MIKIYQPPKPHWVGDGFRVSGFLHAYPELENRLNPFLLLDYHPPFHYAPLLPGQSARGVGTHPHRGFETVTLALQGSVAHHDSQGNSGVIHPGDIQWMTAAQGILHSEYHDKDFSENGGIMHMIQLWVNLPKKDKMSPPRYQAITHSEFQTVTLKNSNQQTIGTLKVIAGQFAHQNQTFKGKASTFTPIELYDIQLQAGAEFSFPIHSHYNTGLLMVEGDATVTSSNNPAPLTLSEHAFAVTESENQLQLTTTKGCRVIVMSGEPIPEPIASYGPFVMNTMEEIKQAIQDYQSGKLGQKV